MIPHLIALSLRRAQGPDDGLRDLFHGISGAEAPEASDDDDGADDANDPDMHKEAEAPAAGRYVPPAARARAAAAAAVSGGGSSASQERLIRALRGLLNRIGDANAQAVTQEIADLPSVTGVSRHALCLAVAREVNNALLNGPRASHAYTCALAACIAALSAAIGPDVGAMTMGLAAGNLDGARGTGPSEEGANPQGATNLAALLARLYICGLAPPSVLWGLLHHVTVRLGELDVAITLHVLRCAGPKLRADDPEHMKDFIVALQQRVRDSNAASGDDDRGSAAMTTRARVLLDLVIDLKNGKKGAQSSVGGKGPTAADEAQIPPAVSRWLRDAGISVPASQLCGLTFSALLQAATQNVVGERSDWWRTHGLLEDEPDTRDDRDGGKAHTSRRNAAGGDEDAQRLLQAAADQRMNTSARRAAFVALMGADDVADASERLLRLGLPAAAERDILRVVLHCCLGEQVYNPFYDHVAARLCAAHKRHRVTLQYCVWDAWKAVIVPGDGAYDVRQLSHLARFVAATLIKGALPFSALRGADWSGAQTSAQAVDGTVDVDGGVARAQARRIAHLRLLMRALLMPPRTTAEVHALFSRGAGRPQLGLLRTALLQFMRRHMLADNEGGGSNQDELLAAVGAAEAGLNGEAVPQAMPR